jgi:hypothetical protein
LFSSVARRRACTLLVLLAGGPPLLSAGTLFGSVRTLCAHCVAQRLSRLRVVRRSNRGPAYGQGLPLSYAPQAECNTASGPQVHESSLQLVAGRCTVPAVARGGWHGRQPAWRSPWVGGRACGGSPCGGAGAAGARSPPCHWPAGCRSSPGCWCPAVRLRARGTAAVVTAAAIVGQSCGEGARAAAPEPAGWWAT